jgi:hypothetical protein
MSEFQRLLQEGQELRALERAYSTTCTKQAAYNLAQWFVRNAGCVIYEDLPDENGNWGGYHLYAGGYRVKSIGYL